MNRGYWELVDDFKYMSKSDFDIFVRQYIETALWSSTDDEGEPLDGLYYPSDISVGSVVDIARECYNFLTYKTRVGVSVWEIIGSEYSRAGHDFWLTRNGHGAGFWDGDWPEGDGKILTDISKTFGPSDLMVTDDNWVEVV